MKTLSEYIGETYEILDDLCKRLQDDYDGNTPFEQKEEDRLVMCNVLELYDHFKEQYITCGLGLVKINTRFVVLVDEDSNMLPTLVEFKYPIEYGDFRFKFQYFKRELFSKDDYEYDDLYRWIDDNYEVKKMTFLDNLIHFVEYI